MARSPCVKVSSEYPTCDGVSPDTSYTRNAGYKEPILDLVTIYALSSFTAISRILPSAPSPIDILLSLSGEAGFEISNDTKLCICSPEITYNLFPPTAI